MTIAHSLHNKNVEDKHFTDAIWDCEKTVWQFSDGSKAKVLTKFREVPAYQSSSLSTMSKERYYIWMEV